MSRIKRITPKICPQCNHEDSLVVKEGILLCRLCGYRDEPEGLQPPALPLARKRKWLPSYGITHVGPIDSWARSAFDTAQACIHQEDWEGARRAFHRALDAQPDFIDAHLWLARLEDEESIKRDHLTTILAHMPNHLEATRELMVLNGQLTEEQAASLTDFSEPEIRQVDAAVSTTVSAPKCPNCGGRLETNEMTGNAICAFCGFEQATGNQSGELGSVMMALLAKRATPVMWVIGERLLHCDSCGAERTIAGDKLSSHCVFCGSTQVVVQDALNSFREPEAVIPFRINRDMAGTAIRDQLKSTTERIKGWFDNNKVSRATLNGIYLPFWVFDNVLDVTRTVIDKRSGTGRVAQANAYTTATFTDMVNNLPICAVSSPPPNLTDKLGKYDLEQLIAYEPKSLAEYPAELYTMDFDKASLEARGVISKMMRAEHGYGASANVTVNVSTLIRQMTFRLILMPVWVGTLLEKDGDIRLALVNGQTGKVALGKAQRQK